VPGSITFEWLEDGRFLIQPSRNDHELFPDPTCVIGAPGAGDGLVMESFDSRGVRRTYGVSLDDGVLRMWRDHPGFDPSATGPASSTNDTSLPRTPSPTANATALRSYRTTGAMAETGTQSKRPPEARAASGGHPQDPSFRMPGRCP
jgi:hypothetical protein